ncbi:MAG TPA: hypothetical protein VG368_04675 [Acidimicrobiales bacterium]|nr:hypothetical protein [Acidimicrobiales bacterium]
MDIDLVAMFEMIKRRFEPALANRAPRTNDIGKYLYVHAEGQPATSPNISASASGPSISRLAVQITRA